MVAADPAASDASTCGDQLATSGFLVSSRLFSDDIISGQPSTEPVSVAVGPSQSSCRMWSLVVDGLLRRRLLPQECAALQ